MMKEAVDELRAFLISYKQAWDDLRKYIEEHPEIKESPYGRMDGWMNYEP
jgi:hypothetical protein